MTNAQELGHDPALAALTKLSEVAEAGAHELRALDGELVAMTQRRKRGWTWVRILSTPSSSDLLSRLTRVTSELGSAGNGLRRALARALRDEGMQVTSIAALFRVSRQRVSALIRPDNSPTRTEPQSD